MNESNVSGKFEQVEGKIKQGLGEAFGSEKLANEGAADEVKGHAKEGWGNVKDTASDLTNSAHANAEQSAEHAKLNAEQHGESFRDKVTSVAEHAKESLNRGLNHLKGDDHA